MAAKMSEEKKQRIFRCTDKVYNGIKAIAKRENRKIGPQIEHILQEYVRDDKEEQANGRKKTGS